MHLNVLTQCCPAPTFEFMWAAPEDRTASGYRNLRYWTDLAGKLERACVDALFFADVHGVYDVYRDSWEPAFQHAVQVPAIDPLTVLPAAAAVTDHLGFAVTYSTAYHPPYQCARLFSSLDHVTDGRIAWNIVTSYLSSAAKNGLGEHLAHDSRYDRADEYVEVARALWERSWEDGAVVRDRSARTFTDPAKVRQIDHKGEFFTVRGPHLCEPSPQRTPVLYQAGASSRGLAFAAKHAEVVFMTLTGPARGGAQVAELRQAVRESGRDPASVKVLQGMLVMVGQTEEQARAKARLYASLADREALLTKWCGWTGIDVDGYPDDTRLDEIPHHAVRSALSFVQRASGSGVATVGDAREFIGRLPPPTRTTALFGTAEQVADRMEEWLERTGIDGFNLLPCPPGSGVDDVCDLLIPELQRRGLFRTSYDPAEKTLRERYFGAGNAAPRH
ncbi:LLM class flavin-dependent oxidoreductase [Amycolatopsis sp. NPDC004079]|uniref:LLM class flavin-dependent oxidoreductase n=1 Tax=Amycolatopsis sp. NPDC004079 TaxID=3154549 RepID=UPI0033A97FA8